jgi:S1-C subfamily serine protease
MSARASSLVLGVACLVCAVPGLARESDRAERGDDPILAAERHQQALFERVAPSVVFLSTAGRFGSGFFVNDTGMVLTNAHVVDRAEAVEVVLLDGRRFRGEVIELAAGDVDLALVQVPLKGTTALRLGGFAALRVGSWVASVGHGRGGVWSFTTGMVSNIYPDGMGRPVFQTQIPLNPGSSGGPIVDREGRVVGIVTAGMTNSNSINFAIRSDRAIASLAGLRAVSDVITITAPGRTAIFVNGVAAGTGPILVLQAEEGVYEIFAVIKGRKVVRTLEYPKEKAVNFGP